MLHEQGVDLLIQNLMDSLDYNADRIYNQQFKLIDCVWNLNHQLQSLPLSGYLPSDLNGPFSYNRIDLCFSIINYYVNRHYPERWEFFQSLYILGLSDVKN